MPFAHLVVEENEVVEWKAYSFLSGLVQLFIRLKADDSHMKDDGDDALHSGRGVSQRLVVL